MQVMGADVQLNTSKFKCLVPMNKEICMNESINKKRPLNNEAIKICFNKKPTASLVLNQLTW